ncbi:MAG: C_GCAxxG_C_C family protein [Clostridia bacterium]|nr:C_GCAxxG_C_C family protein [Clostridia bacterium]
MKNYAQNKREKAQELFKKGYNCAQAVLLTYAEELGLDEKTAAMISSSFGGGMGRMREVCGAVSGMFMAAGLKYGYSDANEKEGKAKHYALIQELATRFREKNGTIICRELLDGIESSHAPIPSERTQHYYKKRPCEFLVGDAAEIIGRYFSENN